jgi:hypothetical protein
MADGYRARWLFLAALLFIHLHRWEPGAFQGVDGLDELNDKSGWRELSGTRRPLTGLDRSSDVPGVPMSPRFKGVPNFDLSLPCPLCGYKIHPNELLRLASHTIKSPGCGEVFNELGGKKPKSTS